MNTGSSPVELEKTRFKLVLFQNGECDPVHESTPSGDTRGVLDRFGSGFWLEACSELHDVGAVRAFNSGEMQVVMAGSIIYRDAQGARFDRRFAYMLNPASKHLETWGGDTYNSCRAISNLHTSN